MIHLNKAESRGGDATFSGAGAAKDWFEPMLISDDLRSELAPWVYKASMQLVSTFMNSLRGRLSAACHHAECARVIGGGVRLMAVPDEAPACREPSHPRGSEPPPT